VRWKNRSSILIVILLAALGLVLVSGSVSGLAQVASEKTSTLISLDVKQMDLQDVLRLIAEKANLNIIIGEEVAGSVTLRLKNVDLWQALEAVLQTSGFTYREERGIIRVVKIEELVEEKPPPPVLERKRFQLNYIDTAQKEEKDLLQDALGNIIGEEGNFFIDSLTNSVYVTAVPSRIKKVKEYFEGADVGRKRIMIKAEFVEVQISAEEELGIRWRWRGAYEGGTFRREMELGKDEKTFATLATGMGIIFGSAEEAFRAIIDLLISKGKAHLISSPNIVTLEGHEAKIDVGDEYPYRVVEYVEGVPRETIKFLTVGAVLLVTPRIKEGNRIVLDIEPEVSEITGSPPFAGAPPVVGTRKAKTQIAVNAGETIVIGGLLKESEKESREGVPLLSDIPFFGSIFTRKTTEKVNSDLLIFITPYILAEKMEEENIVEKRKLLKVQIEELYQKGLTYEKDGEYEKAKQCFKICREGIGQSQGLRGKENREGKGEAGERKDREGEVGKREVGEGKSEVGKRENKGGTYRCSCSWSG